MTPEQIKLIAQAIRDKTSNYELLIKQEKTKPTGRRDVKLLDSLKQAYQQYNQILDDLHELSLSAQKSDSAAK